MIAIYVMGCDLTQDELRSRLDDEALGEQEIGLNELQPLSNSVRKRRSIATRNVIRQLNVRSPVSHPKDMTTQQMARVTEGEKQLAKSSLRKEEHKKSGRELSHSNREKEEREQDFWTERKTSGTFSEEKGLDPKRNSGLILGDGNH